MGAPCSSSGCSLSPNISPVEGEHTLLHSQSAPNSEGRTGCRAPVCKQRRDKCLPDLRGREDRPLGEKLQAAQPALWSPWWSLAELSRSSMESGEGPKGSCLPSLLTGPHCLLGQRVAEPDRRCHHGLAEGVGGSAWMGITSSRQTAFSLTAFSV